MSYTSYDRETGELHIMTDPNDTEADLAGQVAALQAQMATLRANTPGLQDPVEAHVHALKAHARVVAAAHPSRDFTELLKAVDALSLEGDGFVPGYTELLKETVAEAQEQHAQVAHDLAYVASLARELHRLVLRAQVVA